MKQEKKSQETERAKNEGIMEKWCANGYHDPSYGRLNSVRRYLLYIYEST